MTYTCILMAECLSSQVRLSGGLGSGLSTKLTAPRRAASDESILGVNVGSVEPPNPPPPPHATLPADAEVVIIGKTRD